MYEYESIWCRKKVKYMWHIHSRHITSTMVDQGAKVALEKHGRIEASARSSTPFGLVKVILVKCEEMGTLGTRKTSKNHGLFMVFHIKIASWQLDTNGLSWYRCQNCEVGFRSQNGAMWKSLSIIYCRAKGPALFMEVVSNLKINDSPAILMAHLCLFLGELRNKSHQEKPHHPIVMIHTSLQLVLPSSKLVVSDGFWGSHLCEAPSFATYPAAFTTVTLPRSSTAASPQCRDRRGAIEPAGIGVPSLGIQIYPNLVFVFWNVFQNLNKPGLWAACSHLFSGNILVWRCLGGSFIASHAFPTFLWPCWKGKKTRS